MDPEEQQAKEEHNFPGSAAEQRGSNDTTGGAVDTVTGAVETFAEDLPLFGSFVNLGQAAWDTGAGIAHHMNADDDYAQSTTANPNQAAVDAGNAEEKQSRDDLDAAMGHAINSIPFVGLARSFM
jgi:hypothetical protein